MSVAGLIHKDPNYWKNPEEFDPSRFLDENGKYIPTCDGFQAFGIGKRQCLGEHFARMELFLITASLLQNFTFSPPEGETETSIDPEDIPNLQIPRKDQNICL
ncbi:putative inactive cytochrome P450 2G1 [Armadillidium nasatum]|uniref:Putative inactive cytochrome P450 2G1 n=1 Tax=Armadillidium nasatum TaxID=96803 RepID=A0A5N5SS99_9CRUS|nr:putative inactive cytochrome P450 2G1 [Armadillidium nasatum]